MASKRLISGISSVLILAISITTPARNHPREPNFAEDIAPIIKYKCLPCHGPGGIGPFDFTTARNFNRHIELIRFQLLSKNMPPTRVTSDFGQIAATPPLTDEEIVTFQRYVALKMPEGKPLLEPISRDTAKFSIKKNVFLTVTATPPVPAEGTAFWRIHVLPPLPQNLNLQGFNISPTKSTVLRSAQVAILAPGVSSPENNSKTSVFFDHPSATPLGSWSPGYPDWQLPSNTTKSVPAGSRFIVITKYQPSGRAEPGTFNLNLQTTSTPAANELQTITFENRNFQIRANDAPILTLGKSLTQSATLIGLIPQARFYCGIVENEMQLPGAGVQSLAKIHRWDPYWIGSYLFPKPIPIPAGTNLNFKFNYFNDDRCEMNENRNPETVVSGPRLEDEACKMHVLISRPRR